MSKRYVLSIDQGTTSSRALVFDRQGTICGLGQRELPQHFPDDGWVEHDVEDIWRDVVECCKQAVAKAGIGFEDIAAIGITNQRETTVLWDRATGKAIHHAIVWQDRRTSDYCRQLTRDGHAEAVQASTGLILDSYFSATKVKWLLDNVEGARARADKGELAFGTIDSFLLWRLTSGRVHATDASNAARTMLFDIKQQCWDEKLLELFDIPASLLPEVCDNACIFGETDAALFGTSIPVAGMAGDQQAATFGQACLGPGMLKSTYGTGCFALLNTGDSCVMSTNRLLTTVAYRLNGKPTYAIEGSIFVAGAAVKWLRDSVGLIDDAADTLKLAEAARANSQVFLVPAFTGLGAPYWDADARGALLGMTLDTGRADIVRATLESVGYQTRDLSDAMRNDLMAKDGGALALPKALRVDGGMVANDFVCQFLADILGLPVDRPKVIETTALGAAYLAGMTVGVYDGPQAVADAWQLDRRFEPMMEAKTRRERYSAWLKAVRRVQTDQTAG